MVNAAWVTVPLLTFWSRPAFLAVTGTTDAGAVGTAVHHTHLCCRNKRAAETCIFCSVKALYLLLHLPLKNKKKSLSNVCSEELNWAKKFYSKQNLFVEPSVRLFPLNNYVQLFVDLKYKNSWSFGYLCKHRPKYEKCDACILELSCNLTAQFLLQRVKMFAKKYISINSQSLETSRHLCSTLKLNEK